MSIPSIRSNISPFVPSAEKSPRILNLSNKSSRNFQCPKSFIFGPLSAKKLRHGQKSPKVLSEKVPFNCISVYRKEKNSDALKKTLSFLQKFKSLKQNLNNYVRPLSYINDEKNSNQRIEISTPLSLLENHERIKKFTNFKRVYTRSHISRSPDSKKKFFDQIFQE